MTRRLASMFLCTVCCLLLGLALDSSLAQQAPKMPPDFSFAIDPGSPGTVTFSHDKHHEKNPKCTDCHTKIFKMKQGTSGTLTMAAMDEGKFCGTCHDGQKAFSTKDQASCTRCHAPK